MDRRTFLRGAFGLVIVGLGAGVAGLSASEQAASTLDPTPSPSLVGPAMMEGISLERNGQAFRGVAENTHLFDVDALGAELIAMADGSRTIDEIAEATSEPVNPADVASFFVTLGKSGYLQNKVYVNLTQTIA